MTKDEEFLQTIKKLHETIQLQKGEISLLKYYVDKAKEDLAKERRIWAPYREERKRLFIGTKSDE
tara:strand:- start:59 stop:253 length:195 start_codon:yes stop_codon:yes gene_type:complete